MPRRGTNIYRRKDGRWEGRIKKEGSEKGKRRYTSVYGKTYGEVKNRLDQLRSSSQGHGTSPEGTLGKAVDMWLKEKRPGWKPTTYGTYAHIAGRYILPQLGSVRLECVDGELLEKFLARIREDGEGNVLSASYLRNICAVVLRVLNHVKKKRRCKVEIPENPVRPTGRGQLELPKEYELAVLEKYLLHNADDDTCLGIMVAFHTGLRIGELCALTWGDIDLEENVIYVRRNLQRVKTDEDPKSRTRIQLQTPKTSTSQRMIPIPPVLLSLLESRKGENDSYVIKGKKSLWAEPRTLQYRFARILKCCKLEAFNFHMIRHAFATRCITRGFDVKSLSEILGHSSIQVTLNLYVHSDMQRKRQLMDNFNIYLYQDYSSVV